MIMGSTWTTYTIQEGDTLAVVASRFNMFESILLRQNSLSGANSLVPGTVLKVKNRPFLDKNYLNKLKDVLNVLSEKRKHIFTH
jgi:LysM repeat protein